MAKVHHRKARKDYPDQGINAGDMYYTVSIKTGPRSSRTLRSLKPFKQSQLTTSAFKSGWLSIEEGATEAPDHSLDADAIREWAEGIRELGSEAGDAFDNMPEGLQQGDTGQMLEIRRDEAESVADQLDQLADDFENLEEPELDESAEDPDEAQTEFEDAQADYESERERIISEARDLLGGMPE